MYGIRSEVALVQRGVKEEVQIMRYDLYTTLADDHTKFHNKMTQFHRGNFQAQNTFHSDNLREWQEFQIESQRMLDEMQKAINEQITQCIDRRVIRVSAQYGLSPESSNVLNRRETSTIGTSTGPILEEPVRGSSTTIKVTYGNTPPPNPATASALIGKIVTQFKVIWRY
jgi:hypothetical protein